MICPSCLDLTAKPTIFFKLEQKLRVHIFLLAEETAFKAKLSDNEFTKMEKMGFYLSCGFYPVSH